MSLGTLYSPASQSLGDRVRIAAEFAGVQIDQQDGFKPHESKPTPEFLAKFPLGKVPAFETKDGFCFSETQAIVRYVVAHSPNNKDQLLGKDIQEQAKVDQWISFSDSEISNHNRALYSAIKGHVPWFKPADQTHREALAKSLKQVDDHLATRTFLVNERITLADLNLAYALDATFRNMTGAEERAKIPNAVRFWETVVNQPGFRKIVPESKLIDKALQYVPPVKEKKEPKPQAEPKPKAEKKKKEVEEEEEDLVPAEPKAKNPLDDLPKSAFNLEDWKRAYSNLDTRGPGGSLEWFYEKFDKDGFSIWRVDFKYNEELTLTFMSSNQIGGFFNRLEASRKYLFGSVGVVGTANNSVISGVFIARGPDIKPVVEVAPDWESYNYEKIDLADEKQKAFFEAALAWDLEIDGKKWADGKNFK
jgi:elongation factor 1-gamma